MLAASAALAGPAQDELHKHQGVLVEQLDTCSIIVRTIFVRIRSRQAPDPKDDIKGCVADGKTEAKKRYDALKATIGKKAALELADWRVEWMTAFDAAMPQDTDTEAAYLQRQSQSKGSVNRAANKLDLVLE